MNGVRIEATRFTVTPPLDVVDLHNTQVQVEQRRDGTWTVGHGGMWFNRTGVAEHVCGANAPHCSFDFATAMRIAVEAAQGIAERYRHGS